MRYPSGACKPCNDARAKAYDPEKRKEYRLKYRTENRDKVLAWRRGYRRRGHTRFLDRQGGGCAICGRGDRLVLDHCHESEVERGVLCADCNVVLGLMQDSPDLLRQAALYLETHDG